MAKTRYPPRTWGPRTRFSAPPRRVPKTTSESIIDPIFQLLAWRPPFLRTTHQCFEAGAADAHGWRARVRIIEASLLLGDPGGEHQQHQQVLGARGAGRV